MLQEEFSGGGQFDFGTIAFEKLAFKMIFNFLDVLRYSRLANKKLLRRFSEIKASGYGAENF